MIITDRNLIIPEVGDVFDVLIKHETGHKLIKSSIELAEDPDDCTGCIFESRCSERNKTRFICYGPDRHDGISIRIVPVVPEG